MTSRSDPAGKARPHNVDVLPGLILGIETGSRACSVAILKDGDPMAYEFVATDHGHATMLMPMIERVRTKARCDYAAFNRIAVSVGPGSFTGIRVGLAAALGLSLASGVPVVGISSFHVVGIGTVVDPDFCNFRVFVLLDSRRDEPFLVELDDDGTFKNEPAVVTVAEFDTLLASVGPSVVTGDAPALSRPLQHFPPHVRVQTSTPDASLVARLAAYPGHRFDLPPKPVYIRPPDVTMPKPK